MQNKQRFIHKNRKQEPVIKKKSDRIHDKEPENKNNQNIERDMING